MGSSRRGSRAVLSSIVVGLLAALVMTSGASGDSGNPPDDGAEPVTETPDPPPPDVQPSPPGHDPFEMYPADEGARRWEDLTADERAAADAAQEWAETQNGADVHNAFSAAVATTSQMRVVGQAEQESGLSGISTLGVVQ